MKPALPRPLRLLAALALAFAATAAEPVPLPAGATVVARCATLAGAPDPAWTGAATAAADGLALAGARRGGSVGVALAATELAAQADDSLAILVRTAPGSSMPRLSVQLTDQDGRTCAWTFALPRPEAGLTLVRADGGASLAVPNRPDPRDCGVNDLRRISACRLAADPEAQGQLNATIAAVLAVPADAAALAARKALAEQHQKIKGWAAGRDALAAKFIASFPDLSATSAATAPGKLSVRAFHIGNSLTFKALSCPYKTWSLLAYEERVMAFMDGRGVRYVPGWHISWGASLPSLWNHRFAPAVANAGPAGRALTDCTWDLLTLQLWGADAAGDVEAARHFIDLGVARNPALKTYLVETWVRREKTLEPAFRTQWERPWKDGQAGGIPPIHCRAYARLVFERLATATAGLRHPLRLIPVGSVLAELDARMRAGTVPGYTRVEDLYNDEVHLTEEGNYVALETFWAVLFARDPRGLPRTALFPTVSDAFAAQVQQAVWLVVTGTPESGVR